tara:strand:+ start:464 stop:967 length:504 start_codon:yes stop_codon:yes gene_type:complete
MTIICHYFSMKKIRLKTIRINEKLYFKIPSIVEDAFDLNEHQSVEVSLYNKKSPKQTDLWPIHPEDLAYVKFLISDDVYTMNMYNRIYIPEKYRFFFPKENKNFLISTNSGTLKTHLSANGYLTSGLRHWFSLNGPLMKNDLIKITINDQEKLLYELIYKKNNESDI